MNRRAFFATLLAPLLSRFTQRRASQTVTLPRRPAQVVLLAYGSITEVSGLWINGEKVADITGVRFTFTGANERALRASDD